jgi:hypothetical protein
VGFVRNDQRGKAAASSSSSSSSSSVEEDGGGRDEEDSKPSLVTSSAAQISSHPDQEAGCSKTSDYAWQNVKLRPDC